MAAFIKDLFDLPDVVRGEDFVLRLTLAGLDLLPGRDDQRDWDTGIL